MKNETTKEMIIRKLTSRKLWIAVAEFVAMVMIYNGAAENHAAQVVSIIMAGAGVVGYILAEGLADSFADKPDE